MEYPVFYRGLPDATANADKRYGSPEINALQMAPRDRLRAAEFYSIDPPLAHAINVALVLGMPLLVTGEPGVGKTDLGRAIAHELNAGPALKFEAKADSHWTDLFYTFDVLSFHAAASAAKDPRPVNFITYNALGRATLNANKKEDVKDFLPDDEKRFRHSGPKRSVVIIDEIDKAPRDFPNDLLNEIDQMAFRSSELRASTPGMDEEVAAMPAGDRAWEKNRPVVVITSNSEKGLPEPFLRRCIYYHIPFPEKRLTTIVLDRLPGIAPEPLTQALGLFLKFREPGFEMHKPGVAELLNWLQVLQAKNLMNGTCNLWDDSIGDDLTSSLYAIHKELSDVKSTITPRVLDAWRVASKLAK